MVVLNSSSNKFSRTRGSLIHDDGQWKFRQKLFGIRRDCFFGLFRLGSVARTENHQRTGFNEKVRDIECFFVLAARRVAEIEDYASGAFFQKTIQLASGFLG